MLCNEEEFESWSPQFSEEGVLWNCTMTIRYVKLKTKILKKNIWEYVDFSNAMPNGWLKYFGNQGNLERMADKLCTWKWELSYWSISMSCSFGWLSKTSLWAFDHCNYSQTYCIVWLCCMCKIYIISLSIYSCLEQELLCSTKRLMRMF